MDEMDRYLDALASGAFDRDLFERTAECYAHMYHALRQRNIPEITAREITCAHIEALGRMGGEA